MHTMLQRSMLKKELNSANRIQAINTLAIPVVTDGFNIINSNFSDIQKMDLKICAINYYLCYYYLNY